MMQQLRAPAAPSSWKERTLRAATATVTEVDKGARLDLRPTDASQLDHLREHARWHQQRMESGECWMLQDQPAATPRGGQE